MKKIRVLVVDDSLLFRNTLVQCLESDPYIEVVAQAGDPYEARDAIIEHHPDVMTLDIEMPKMNGIEFLKKLMPQYPLPVVMISSLDDKVFDALEAGAVDFICKPTNVNRNQLNDFLQRELVTKVKIASTAKVASLKKVDAGKPGAIQSLGEGGKEDTIIAIGASTGGTEAIFEVVKQFKRNTPGVVIVQHMPPGFTEMYAKRLNEQCEMAVKEAQTGDRVLPGQILIAPGDKQMRLVKIGDTYQVECRGNERVNGHCPSVDVLFQSVAKHAGKNAIGIILTGMGGDGARGLLEMRRAGARTIGQDQESCIVYGMPKVAYDLGAVQHQLSLTNIPGKVHALLREKR